jgi:hypothetical protein
MRSMMFQSTTKFLPSSWWVLGSLLFVADNFGYLNLQVPESREVIRSGTSPLPPILVRVDLINEAHLRHGSNELGKLDLDPLGDKVDHNSTGSPAIIDPIHLLSLESDS